MKKIFLLLICILINNTYYSQTFSYNTGVSQPVPSVSSLATYTNVPVSMQTGIPDISYPLVNVPTNSSSVNISLALNYHPANVVADPWSGDLGMGWSLLGQGVITRDNYNDPDESFDTPTRYGYIENDFDDVYNYNIPGESGKFKFVRDTLNNTFQLLKLSPTTSKIEYQRNSNQATLILDSFTITNDRGIKFKFNTYNISTATVWRFGYPRLNDIYGSQKYRSAFFLTSILDESNQELATFTYFKDITYVLGSDNQAIESESYKLSRIDIKDRGIIELGYIEKDYSPKSDKFWLRNITLKTADNQFVSKYTMEGSGPLTALNKLDANNTILEKTTFGYDSASLADGFPPSVPDGIGVKNVYGQAVLNRVHLPTGGTIEYKFDFVPFFQLAVGTVIPAAIQDVGYTGFGQYNSPTKQFFFNLTEQKKLNIIVPVGSLSGHLWNLVFYKKVGTTYQTTPYSLGNMFLTDPNDFPEQSIITFAPGEYYAVLNSTTSGSFVEPISFFATETIGEPMTIQEPRSYQRGFPRIRKISYYNENTGNLPFTTAPTRIEEYNYQKFDDPNSSSVYFEGGGFEADGMTPGNPSIVYKNIKVSGGTEGYTKYYYKASDAYPMYTVPSPDPLVVYGVIPNYNLTRDGLLEKSEVYNAANQKVSEDIFDYTMEDYPSAPYPLINNGIDNTPYTKTAWMKNQTITSRNYFDSGFSETKTETFRNTNNYRTNLERTTAFNGVIQETSYQYALDKSNQKLIDANMFGVSLETMTKTKKNLTETGKVLSKVEVKYDAANLFPSSVLNYDIPNNTTSTEIIYDRYDNKGNLEQYTTKEGIPVTVIWGYHKTQPIAKIEGATYSQVSAYISDIVTKSDADINAVSEQALVTSLDTFRNNQNFTNYLITTYIYDPLVGIKSTTPPSGIREIYKYDKANRLEQVADENGNILQKYKYNYKQ